MQTSNNLYVHFPAATDRLTDSTDPSLPCAHAHTDRFSSTRDLIKLLLLPLSDAGSQFNFYVKRANRIFALLPASDVLKWRAYPRGLPSVIECLPRHQGARLCPRRSRRSRRSDVLQVARPVARRASFLAALRRGMPGNSSREFGAPPSARPCPRADARTCGRLNRSFIFKLDLNCAQMMADTTASGCVGVF